MKMKMKMMLTLVALCAMTFVTGCEPETVQIQTVECGNAGDGTWLKGQNRRVDVFECLRRAQLEASNLRKQLATATATAPANLGQKRTLMSATAAPKAAPKPVTAAPTPKPRLEQDEEFMKGLNDCMSKQLVDPTMLLNEVEIRANHPGATDAEIQLRLAVNRYDQLSAQWSIYNLVHDGNDCGVVLWTWQDYLHDALQHDRNVFKLTQHTQSSLDARWGQVNRERHRLLTTILESEVKDFWPLQLTHADANCSLCGEGSSDGPLPRDRA